MSNIIILTEGGTMGLGHVKRSLVLARALTERGAAVSFVTDPKERIGWEMLKESEFEVGRWSERKEDAVIVDVENFPGYEWMNILRKSAPKVILVNGVSYPPVPELEPLCDLIVYQGELFDYPDSSEGKVLNGPRYLMVDPAYSQCTPNPDGPIVVSMGGRDPYNLTPIVVEAFADVNISLRVVIGPAFSLSSLLRHKKVKYVLIPSPPNLLETFNGASLAIVTTGMTAYEALAAGVPCILANISEDHNRVARGLQLRECAINLGMWDEVDAVGIRNAVTRARLNWVEMSRKGRGLVDGRGVGRVADRIMEMVL